MLLILLIAWAVAIALLAWAIAMAAGHADDRWERLARTRPADPRAPRGRNRLAA
jgi:hypothetical protein